MFGGSLEMDSDPSRGTLLTVRMELLSGVEA